ncbi:hypothetical protein ES319_A09G034300v1 [Gossypium barbadense]|uniref:Response regulatory domain-containing protein n=1 Tax=Gossypium barbadense TaxID=3634 RepID=A0A5J5UAN5_GOSBA|nr:hypothetical protein ES319_A09G034300v1 [Gossypium barbadense]
MLRAVAFGLLISLFAVLVSATDNELASCNCDDEGLWSVHSILECQKTYYGPHSFQLMLSLTIANLLTTLVLCATVITLLTLIPLLLKIKVRDIFLRQNVLELDQEVDMMKRNKEANSHVLMLTQEIKKSLDKHTILMRILRLDSALGLASGIGSEEVGVVAAIRMPMLQGYNFKGGTPELVETCYAIPVLVLPNANSRNWSYPEMEIVEVVADQVAVALSHAIVLEESQRMREKLSQQNYVLQQERKNAMIASQARNSFQKVMSNGLLSVFQDENINFKQKTIVDTLVKTSSVLSTLINDVMEISAKDNGRFLLNMRPFSLHSMIKETCCLAKSLSIYKGFDFEVGVQSSLPDQVIGDERRTFQVILHMVGYLLDINSGGETVFFQVLQDVGGQDKDKINVWRSSTQDNYLYLKIEIDIRGGSSVADASNKDEIKESLNFTMCKKLVQMMQGNVWISTNSVGFAQSMTLLLRFQIQSYVQRTMFAFRGLRVLLADDDDINRTVTKKLLEKLGCEVTVVSSGFECLSAVSHAENSFRIVVLDLHMPEMDGFKVAMRIRKFHNHNWPLIIALIARMNAILQKPVLLQGMEDELQRVLQRTGEV